MTNKRTSLDLGPLKPITPGIAGVVECIAAAMEYQGHDVDLDELYCASSAAFANYIYTPEVNQHQELSFSSLGELFSNYGVFESLAYYTGWQVNEVNNLSNHDFWALVKFEILSGRPLVSVGLGDGLYPVLITGFEEGPKLRTVHVRADGEVRTFDIWNHKPQGDSEVFVNFAGLVRPSEAPDWAAGVNKQRMHAIRWGASHAEGQKEFFHETRENYLTGQVGVKALTSLASGEKSEAFWSYIFDLGRSRLVTRSAAAKVLPKWGRAFAQELGDEALAVHLEEAGTAYAESVAALQGVDDGWDHALALYATAESEAMAKLIQASELLPSAFG